MKMKYLVPEIHVLGVDDTDRFDVYDSAVGNAAKGNDDNNEQGSNFQLPVL